MRTAQNIPLSLIIFASIAFFLVSSGKVLGKTFPFPETKYIDVSPKALEEYCLQNGVDPDILKALVLTESGSVVKNGHVYPFYIRVNSSVRIKGLKEIRKNVYDCVNREVCRIVSQKLIDAGAVNFDAGAFQFNYKYWLKRGWKKEEFLSTVFDFSKSWKKACLLVKKFLITRGYTANAVALYHSADGEENYRYAKRFYRYYRMLKKHRK